MTDNPRVVIGDHSFGCLLLLPHGDIPQNDSGGPGIFEITSLNDFEITSLNERRRRDRIDDGTWRELTKHQTGRPDNILG
jgi:hypothetical protein